MINDLHNLQKMTMKTLSSQYEKIQHYALAPFIAAGLLTLLVIGTAYHTINHLGNKNGETKQS